jgi:hypothetical protein
VRHTDDLIETLADAARWQEQNVSKAAVVGTKAILGWAFVNSPTVWNDIRRRLPAVHPDDAQVEAAELISPLDLSHERLGSNRITADAADALRIAEQLCHTHALPPDEHTLAFAALLVRGSFAWRWATSEAANADAVHLVATKLFPTLREPIVAPASATRVQPERRLGPESGYVTIRLVPTAVVFLVLWLVFELNLFLAASVASVVAIRLPPQFSRQTRTRIGLMEFGGAAALCISAWFVVGSVPRTIEALGETKLLVRAETAFAAHRPADTIDLLNNIPVARRAPRFDIARACAAYELGNREMAFFYLQGALLVGQAAPATTRLEGCFLNRTGAHGQIAYLTTQGGWSIVVPASRDVRDWVSKARDHSRHDATAALFLSACAHHFTDSKIVAALLFTLALKRAEVDPFAPNPLSQARIHAVVPVRECLRAIETSRDYQLLRGPSGLLVRPKDYQERIR